MRGSIRNKLIGVIEWLVRKDLKFGIKELVVYINIRALKVVVFLE